MDTIGKVSLISFNFLWIISNFPFQHCFHLCCCQNVKSLEDHTGMSNQCLGHLDTHIHIHSIMFNTSHTSNVGRNHIPHSQTLPDTTAMSQSLTIQHSGTHHLWTLFGALDALSDTVLMSEGTIRSIWCVCVSRIHYNVPMSNGKNVLGKYICILWCLHYKAPQCVGIYTHTYTLSRYTATRRPTTHYTVP